LWYLKRTNEMFCSSMSAVTFISTRTLKMSNFLLKSSSYFGTPKIWHVLTKFLVHVALCVLLLFLESFPEGWVYTYN
jgi:hypothetical protein